VIESDRPWEHKTYFSYANYSVFKDEADGLIKCWYEDFDVIPGVYPAPNANRSRMLYAYSEDGINFIKPEMDLFKIDNRKTNIVLGDENHGWVHAGTVIIDPHPASPERRFLALFERDWTDASKNPHHRVETACSPDGVHWQVQKDLPRFGISGPNLNDVMMLWYDHDTREFMLNTRHYLQWAGALNSRNPRTQSFNGPRALDNWALQNQRRVWQSRSHDFIHWSEPMLIAATDDEEDNLDESFYGMGQCKVGSTYLGFVGVLHSVDQTRDVQLLVSRDALHWKRTNKRQPFVPVTGEGNWNAYMTSVVSPPLEMGDELWFYVGGSACTHDMWLCRNEGFVHPEHKDPSLVRLSLHLAKLRRDGYASLDANQYREGTVITRALISTGQRLEINARCRPGGSIRVEIADNCDEVFEQCRKADCDAFTGDSVRHTVTWKGNPNIPASSWRKLRFSLRDAELFSFRFVDLAGQPFGNMDIQGTGQLGGPSPAEKCKTPFFKRMMVSKPVPADERLTALAYPKDQEALAFKERIFASSFLKILEEIKKEFSPDKRTAFFFRTRLEAAEDMDINILLGYDGPVKVWLDQKEIFHDPQGTNPCSFDKGKITVAMKAGSHELLIALGDNRGNAEGIFLRCQRTDIPLEKLQEYPQGIKLPSIQ
jgi:hypothetical protein